MKSGPERLAGGSPLLSENGIVEVRSALREASLDGWLLFEFHGLNPVAAALLELGFTSRRSFVLIPAAGPPIALIHRIEGSSWRHWPWEKRWYAGWREMEEELGRLLSAGSRLAMEYSPGSAVPTVDLVPAGVLELVRERGVEPVGSGDLVSRFHARWTGPQRIEHRKAAEILAAIAREAFERAASRVRAGRTLTEGELRSWILDRMAEEGVSLDTDCIVATGPQASDPHYMPGNEGEPIGRDQLLLVDLWGRTGPGAVPADQTWMGYLGPRLPEKMQDVWNAVRDARDQVVVFLEERHAAGEQVRGYEADDVARGLIRERGFGDHFLHRTGHSMDTNLHGSGPNLDNLETRDERLLVPGVGFSVEPGVYLPGEFGIRSEINVFLGEDGPEVTPAALQREIPRLIP